MPWRYFIDFSFPFPSWHCRVSSRMLLFDPLPSTLSGGKQTGIRLHSSFFVCNAVTAWNDKICYDGTRDERPVPRSRQPPFDSLVSRYESIFSLTFLVPSGYLHPFMMFSSLAVSVLGGAEDCKRKELGGLMLFFPFAPWGHPWEDLCRLGQLRADLERPPTLASGQAGASER
jgi:hypothetical protein